MIGQGEPGEEKEEVVEEKVAEMHRQMGWQVLRKGQGGTYFLGQKRVQVALDGKERLGVRTGGGWMQMEEFLAMMQISKD